MAPDSAELPVIDLILNGYTGLFLAAFVAATLLPAQSELVLVTMMLSGRYESEWLFAVATIGNVLGSMLNWAMGRFLGSTAMASRFRGSQAAMVRAERWYRRWGSWSLLACWVPVIGDPLTFLAGLLRMPFMRFALIVTLAKAGRYLVVMLGAAGMAG